ncbi:hypothetical protein D3H35_19785 [Cohnella faecalis]|uniref:Uncharacterized protein n=1 Tax=Cohnella faecalis TaxID=2315694 RepID=A0A398CSS7_9BACL|nr:hypothetical protein D3H35_19785 [Cohnella faecalis]
MKIELLQDLKPAGKTKNQRFIKEPLFHRQHSIQLLMFPVSGENIDTMAMIAKGSFTLTHIL